MKEHGTQNDIRNQLTDDADLLLFRANVGTGFTGNGQPFIASRPCQIPLNPGDAVIRGARRFSTGLPEGFSDLFGIKTVTVTPEMVGQRIGVFVAVECKSATGRAREQQPKFIAAVRRHGGRAGFARTVDHARNVIDGGFGCEQLNLLEGLAASNTDSATQRRGATARRSKR